MKTDKPKGTSMLFVNSKGEVLLFLRDDIPQIRYPNCWDILGGHVEEDETSEECIIREMKEEIEVDIINPKLFKVSDMGDRVERTFWQKADWKIDEIILNEGQRLKWFSKSEIQELPEGKIAFGFKPVILEFFRKRPFKESLR